MAISAGIHQMPLLHPGESLREDLEAYGLTPQQTASALRVPPARLIALLDGQSALSADLALRLNAYHIVSSISIWRGIVA
jgi:addiction module HigA family antidote